MLPNLSWLRVAEPRVPAPIGKWLDELPDDTLQRVVEMSIDIRRPPHERLRALCDLLRRLGRTSLTLRNRAVWRALAVSPAFDMPGARELTDRDNPVAFLRNFCDVAAQPSLIKNRFERLASYYPRPVYQRQREYPHLWNVLAPREAWLPPAPRVVPLALVRRELLWLLEFRAPTASLSVVNFLSAAAVGDATLARAMTPFVQIETAELYADGRARALGEAVEVYLLTSDASEAWAVLLEAIPVERWSFRVREDLMRAAARVALRRPTAAAALARIFGMFIPANREVAAYALNAAMEGLLMHWTGASAAPRDRLFELIRSATEAVRLAHDVLITETGWELVGATRDTALLDRLVATYPHAWGTYAARYLAKGVVATRDYELLAELRGRLFGDRVAVEWVMATALAGLEERVASPELLTVLDVFAPNFAQLSDSDRFKVALATMRQANRHGVVPLPEGLERLLQSLATRDSLSIQALIRERASMTNLDARVVNRDDAIALLDLTIARLEQPGWSVADAGMAPPSPDSDASS